MKWRVHFGFKNFEKACFIFIDSSIFDEFKLDQCRALRYEGYGNFLWGWPARPLYQPRLGFPPQHVFGERNSPVWFEANSKFICSQEPPNMEMTIDDFELFAIERLRGGTVAFLYFAFC